MAQQTTNRQKAVRIRTLGRFEVEVDGAPLRIGSRGHSKPFELLKLLVAMGGEGVACEHLSDALWPDGDGDTARGALTTNLYRLRKQIGIDSLRLDDARLNLERDRCWVDAWAFAESLEGAERASASGDAEQAWALAQEALALYRGPFLDGEFDLPDVLTAREKLHAMFLRHVETLGAYFRDDGATERAIALFRQGLECDELADGFYRSLMECYRDAGRPGEAVSLYQRCREMMRAGGGIEPAPETTDVYEAIVAATRTPPEQPRTEPSRPDAPPAPSTPTDSGTKWDDRLRLAVLPFTNLSGDPEQDYFGSGIAEDLITDLSRISRLAVAPHTNIPQGGTASGGSREQAEALGVRYLLEGSVRKSAERVRVTARLFDAQEERQTWAERYDREWGDLFKVQDELTRNIVTALDVHLLEGEQARIWRRSTDNPEAYDRYLRGRNALLALDRANVMRARRLFEEAIALDPTFAVAIGRNALMLTQCVRLGWVEDEEVELQRALTMAQEALSLDPTLGEGHVALTNYNLMKGDWESALSAAEEAVRHNPESFDFSYLLARARIYSGSPEEALESLRRAKENMPGTLPPPYYLIMGHTLFWLDRLDEAQQSMKSAVDGAPDGPVAHVYLTAFYEAAGRHEDAVRQASEVRRINPSFAVDEWTRRALLYRKPEWLERIQSLLRQAGLE